MTSNETTSPGARRVEVEIVVRVGREGEAPTVETTLRDEFVSPYLRDAAIGRRINTLASTMSHLVVGSDPSSETSVPDGS